MTVKGPKEVALVVRERLLNRSRQTGEDFQFLLQHYAAERFLYRLGCSPHRERFVLKGAMLFALWGGSFYRPTRDLDFTGYGQIATGAILDAMRDICTLVVEDDGVVFRDDTLKAGPIRDEAEYGGVRVVFQAGIGTARIRMQVDIGFGDAIEPGAALADYPTLLELPAPRIRVYPHEMVVAEKLHAMVTLGEINSRYKDFYDLYVMISQFPFDGGRLSRAVAATFERRRTPITGPLPVALTSRFYADTGRAEQWRAYLGRNGLAGVPTDLVAVGEKIMGFLGPVWTALVRGER
jgi:predicted nucleotidyltransferase component of viral defense system